MTGFIAIAVLLYLSALGVYLASYYLKRKSLGSIGYKFVLLGLAVHTMAIIYRWQMAGRPPATNMHESMIMFSWAVIAIGAWFERGHHLGCFSPLVVFAGAVLLGASCLWDGTIYPLTPALKSPWLFWHVASCMIAYGALGVGWVAGCLYLGLARGAGATTRVERLAAIDHLSYQAIIFGFTMLAVGIITGSIWGNLAWGSWWSWDPKETWALITWLTYAIYLHNRNALKCHARKLAWFAVCAFPLVLFTYFGVNYLLVGLHSYAG